MLKPYKKIFEDEIYFEMAILDDRHSGIKEGYIQVRFEQRHVKFPHIHYFYAMKNKEHEFIKYSIDKNIDNIRIIEQHNITVSKKEENMIKQFIVKNYQVLYDYYMLKGETIITTDFLNSLKRFNE